MSLFWSWELFWRRKRTVNSCLHDGPAEAANFASYHQILNPCWSARAVGWRLLGVVERLVPNDPVVIGATRQ
ncbi:hypothetical protein NKH81_34370 [Mesorhizobium sp. M0959]|uniref:hypothetical protein n=1 Tax=Mesorhizobium sp. M0959 TaxID=2957034 RepID=UPI003338D2BD